jgi:predicted Fe-Mo cluster-binding NifX family protein
MLYLIEKIMKIAIPIWNDRVSPVLDTARELLVVEQDRDGQQVRNTMVLPESSLPYKARLIGSNGISALICGAVSRGLEMMLTNEGIRVIPWVRGKVDNIISAYYSGNLNQQGFRLPGCGRGRQGRRRRRGRFYREDNFGKYFGG